MTLFVSLNGTRFARSKTEIVRRKTTGSYVFLEKQFAKFSPVRICVLLLFIILVSCKGGKTCGKMWYVKCVHLTVRPRCPKKFQSQSQPTAVWSICNAAEGRNGGNDRCKNKHCAAGKLFFLEFGKCVTRSLWFSLAELDLKNISKYFITLLLLWLFTKMFGNVQKLDHNTHVCSFIFISKDISLK